MDPSSFHAPKEERLFGRRKSSVGAHPFVEETQDNAVSGGRGSGFVAPDWGVNVTYFLKTPSSPRTTGLSHEFAQPKMRSVLLFAGDKTLLTRMEARSLSLGLRVSCSW